MTGRLRSLVVRGIVALAVFPAAPALAQFEEAPIDTTVLPSYTTSYDRDRNRELWTQILNYGLTSKRTNFNLNGAMSTQNYLASPSKSTFGNINGTLSYGLIGTWVVALSGNYDMNSSTDGPNNLETRGNRLNLRTQYLFYPLRGMKTYLSLYSEFQQKHDRNRNDRVRRADPLEVGEVDTSFAQRDSSYTTSRNDAVSGDVAWGIRSWLNFSGSALAYRTQSTITSYKRTFVNPLDGGPGAVSETRERTSTPNGNTRFTSSLGFRRAGTNLSLSGAQSSLRQSYFDKQRSAQENSKLDNTTGGVAFDSPILRGLFLHAEGGLVRNLNEYTLNRNRTTLTHSQKVLSLLSFSNPKVNGNVNFSQTRTKTELQPSVNGIEVNRVLTGMFRWSTGRKLVLDGNGSVTLLSNDFENDKIDRDIQRTYFSVGSGYVLTPACSTSVHFSRGRGHTISLDPSVSGSNSVTTTYQMNATMVYLPTPDFALRQNYLISAEYRILDYVESQNTLVRARRVDTDVADTLFQFAIVRLTHNFVFQDQGAFTRTGSNVDRTYKVSTRSYDQTVTATVGARLAPGILFLATQSLLNRRAEAVAAKSNTLQNTWKLNLSLQIFRTLSNGFQIDGALRRLSEYVEGKINSKDTTRDDWVAGVSIHKDF